MVLLPRWGCRSLCQLRVVKGQRTGEGERACAASISLHIHFLAHSFNFERWQRCGCQFHCALWSCRKADEVAQWRSAGRVASRVHRHNRHDTIEIDGSGRIKYQHQENYGACLRMAKTPRNPTKPPNTLWYPFHCLEITFHAFLSLTPQNPKMLQLNLRLFWPFLAFFLAFVGYQFLFL